MTHFSVLTLCLFVAAAAQAQPPVAPSRCRSVAFTSELDVYDDFEQDLGGGLVFRVKSFKEPAWFIDVVPTVKPDDDYVYPVNPPLRFNGNQTLGPGYSEDVKSSLGHPHEMWFLLTAADYDHVSSLTGNVLWPNQTANPDRARNDYLAALRTVRTGWVKLTVGSYSIDSSGQLSRMQFGVQVIAPADFKFAADLKPRRVGCPPKSNFP